ncbi:MAG: glycosyltransferase [Lacipirellulaceae bacterium]
MSSQQQSSQSPLRILLVTSTYPRHEEDYAVPWLRESVRQLSLRGHEVTVLAPAYRGLPDHDLDGVTVKRFRYANAEWETLTHEGGAPARISNPLFQLLAAPYVAAGCLAARRLARQQEFDIVHTHWPFPHGPIGASAARAAKVPHVVTSHGAGLAIARRKKWVRPILRHSLQAADLSIANSMDTAEKVREVSGVDSLVLPFGTTVAAKNIPAPKNRIPRILFTGRLIERKGVEYLLKAADRVLRKREAQFVICGDGPARDRLERLCSDLSLDHAIRFLGFVSNEWLNEEYSRCDIWVNPAVIDRRGDTEGLGVGAIEAYAHAKPVIASKVGGIPDAVVHNQTGLLTPERDEAALAEAIMHLIDNPVKAKAMGAVGLQFAQQKFNWERITDELVTAYCKLIGRDSAEFDSSATIEVPALSNGDSTEGAQFEFVN